MKTLSFIVLCFYISLNASAQIHNPVFRIKDGGDIRTVSTPRERFLYDGFQMGKVYFKNGKISVARLNYSFFHGEIQFIGPQKDTLLLTENDFISNIIINGDHFYFEKNQGHAQNIGEYGKIILGRKQQLLFFDKEKNSGYNEYTSSSPVSSYTHFTNSNGETQALKSDSKLLFRKHSYYYFIDRNRKFNIANRVNLVKIYPDHKRAINNYLKDAGINFLDENDLVKVLLYCQSL
jgi:hypothetical protein